MEDNTQVVEDGDDGDKEDDEDEGGLFKFKFLFTILSKRRKL